MKTRISLAAAALLFSMTQLFGSVPANNGNVHITDNGLKVTAVTDCSAKGTVHICAKISGINNEEIIIRTLIREKNTGEEIGFSREYTETSRTVEGDSLYTINVTQDIVIDDTVYKSRRYEAVTEVYTMARPPKKPEGARMQMIQAKEIHADTFIKSFKFKTK